MGVVNVTPDSFSDGGAFMDVSAAVDHAVRLAGEGADLVDLGAESTRPGSEGVPAEEQIRRLLPVLRGVRDRLPDVVISIDTTEGSVAEAGLKSGGNIINDISGGTFDGKMLGIVAKQGAAAVLMHMQGRPAMMQENPRYSDVVGEVTGYLRERARAAMEAGVERHRVLVDPGIGFGKTDEHNLALLKGMRAMAEALKPQAMVIGTSRKGFIGRITGERLESGRKFGTAATVAHAAANGAGVVRVHDVAEMAAVVKMIRAIEMG